LFINILLKYFLNNNNNRWVSDDQLTGSIPTEIGNLTGLKEL